MQGGYIRQERPYVTFAALFVSEKREKKKSFFMFLRGRTMFDPTIAGRRGIKQCEALVGVAETG